MTLGEAAAWLQTHAEINSVDEDTKSRGSSVKSGNGKTLNTQKAYKFQQKLNKQGLP